MAELRIGFGALDPSIREQLIEQGFPLPEDIDHVDRDVEALNRLRIRKVFTGAEARKGEERIFKKLKRWLSSELEKEAG